jgi:hypothetical protein
MRFAWMMDKHRASAGGVRRAAISKSGAAAFGDSDDEFRMPVFRERVPVVAGDQRLQPAKFLDSKYACIFHDEILFRAGPEIDRNNLQDDSGSLTQYSAPVCHTCERKRSQG